MKVHVAYPTEENGHSGEIEVRLERHPDGALALIVRDDGVGLPAQAREGSLGLRLIHAFARQVGATLAVPGEGGTTVALTLPVASAARSERRTDTREPEHAAGGGFAGHGRSASPDRGGSLDPASAP
jgi:hypothetical protein